MLLLGLFRRRRRASPLFFPEDVVVFPLESKLGVTCCPISAAPPSRENLLVCYVNFFHSRDSAGVAHHVFHCCSELFCIQLLHIAKRLSTLCPQPTIGTRHDETAKATEEYETVCDPLVATAEEPPSSVAGMAHSAA